MVLVRRAGTWLLGTLAMLAVAASGCVEASAASGDLDPSFGGGHRIVTGAAPANSQVVDVAGWIG